MVSTASVSFPDNPDSQISGQSAQTTPQGRGGCPVHLSSGVGTFLSLFPYQDLNSETGLSHTPACHLTAQPSANPQHQQRVRIRGMEMNKPPQAPKGNSLFGFVLCGTRMKKGRILVYSRSYQWLLKDLWHNTERMQSN